MQEMDHSRSAFAWCLFGAAAGAAAGLLLAPRSGKQTRAKLAKGWRDTLESASELTDDLTDRARGAANELTDKARGAASKAAISLTQRAAKVADTASNVARETAHNLERHAERMASH